VVRIRTLSFKTVKKKEIKLMRKSKGLFFVIITLLLFYVSLPRNSIAQLSGYELLKTDISARASGMSGAFVGVTGDLHALFYNPAGLIGIQNQSLSLTFLDHVLDIKTGSVVFAAPRGIDSKIAFGANYINYGSFEGRDENGIPTSSFDAQDVVFVGGFAKEYSASLFYGLSGEVLYSKIGEFSSTLIGFGGGVIYTIPKQSLTLGLSINNVGFVTSAFIDTKDDVPTVIKGGFTKRLAHLPLLISFEYRQFLDGEFKIVGGGEFTIAEFLKGRLGYNSFGTDQKIGDEGGDFAGASFGFGFNWRKYLIDYSFSSFGVIGNLQRFTFSWII